MPDSGCPAFTCADHPVCVQAVCEMRRQRPVMLQANYVCRIPAMHDVVCHSTGPVLVLAERAHPHVSQPDVFLGLGIQDLALGLLALLRLANVGPVR